MSKYEYVVEFGYKPPSTVPGVIKEEIVRCRDCKHRYTCGSFMFCEFRRPDEPVNADGFCAWGVKRKEDGE